KRIKYMRGVKNSPQIQYKGVNMEKEKMPNWVYSSVFRYALEKRSGIVELTIEWLEKSIDDIPRLYLLDFINEINVAINLKKIENEYNIKEWLDFSDYIKNFLKRK
ncbi:MAG: hypothetical protein ACOC3Z_01000, partial [Nanoarchaeota archaeon]